MYCTHTYGSCPYFYTTLIIINQKKVNPILFPILSFVIYSICCGEREEAGKNCLVVDHPIIQSDCFLVAY